MEFLLWELVLASQLEVLDLRPSLSCVVGTLISLPLFLILVRDFASYQILLIPQVQISILLLLEVPSLLRFKATLLWAQVLILQFLVIMVVFLEVGLDLGALEME